MKKYLSIALVLAYASVGQAQPSNAPSRMDYPSFQIVRDRNISDMNRSPRSSYNSRPRSGHKVGNGVPAGVSRSPCSAR